MSDISLKQQLLEMSLEGALEVIQLIESRPDIQKIIVVTKKQHDESSIHFKQLIERVPDEPA